MFDIEKDREEIFKHWDNLNLFYRLVILFVFSLINHKKIESMNYILNRMYVRPDRMICAYRTEKVSQWYNIKTYLTRKLFGYS